MRSYAANPQSIDFQRPSFAGLAAAAALMLDGDCGFLPAVEDGKLVGVVTDRDMYIALAMRDKRASQITVGDVVQTPVHTCGPDETCTRRSRRRSSIAFGGCPLRDSAARCWASFTMNDILLAAGPREPVREAEVVNTFQAIAPIIILAAHRGGPDPSP